VARVYPRVEAGRYIAIVRGRSGSATAELSIDAEGKVDASQLNIFTERLSTAAALAASIAPATRAAPDAPKAAATGLTTSNVREGVQGIQAMGPRPQPVTRNGAGLVAKINGYQAPVPGGQSPALITKDDIVIEAEEGSVIVRAPRQSCPILIQILSAGQMPVNALLPTGAGLRLRRDTGQWIKIGIDFGEPFANGLVELRSAKQFSALQEAVKVAGDHSILLPYVDQHPGAAVLIGYALLRAQEHEVVETALGRVQNRETMEPDTTVLLAECAAQAGGNRSAVALDLFLEAGAKGVPSFSFGLSYLVERLRMFSQCEPSDAARLSSSASKRAEEVLGRIAPFSMYADYTRVFTAYIGAPAAPGPQRTSDADFANADGQVVQLT
jgi:hypothetical protein